MESRVRGRPGSSMRSGMPISGLKPAARLEEPQHVPRLADLEARQGIEYGTTPFFSISSSLGGGHVLSRNGAPFMP